MNALYFLIGTLALLIALLFFGFIVLLWGLRQLLIIGQQNDTVINLLEQISGNIWNEAHVQTGLEEDLGDAAPAPRRELKLRRQNEAFGPPGPRLASLK
jgi:hypothetical protein